MNLMYICSKNNYLYPIKSKEKAEYSFLLFNEKKHYWMPLDEVCAEIYKQFIEKKTIEEISDIFCKKYMIDKGTFYKDTSDFFSVLINKGFIEDVTKKDESYDWMSDEVILERVEDYPFNEIYISISDACNLNCIYCFNKEKRNSRLQNHDIHYMAPNEIKSILKQFKMLGGKRVVFTGGEPTLNANFLDFCKFAKEIELGVSFITNGLLLEQFDFDKLFSNVDSFGISLDSSKSKELEELWGVFTKGMAERILKTLQKIDMWCEINKKSLNIIIMPVITEINKDSLEVLIKTVDKNIKYCNVTWNITKYDKIGKDIIDNKISVTEERYIDSVIRGISSICTDKYKVLSYAYSHGDKLEVSREPKVITCAPSFFVDYTGDIYPCQGCDKKEFFMGNVRKITLEEAFNGNVFKSIRRAIIKNNIKKCGNCELRYVCVTERRPCDSKVTDNCKEKCVERMYYNSLID